MTKPFIYFAGSIRGGRDDQSLYQVIIGLLSQFGEVLTEHIGNKDLTEEGELNLSEQAIYCRDLDWIKKADIFIGEVTSPSLGVGYEIGMAESLKKPIICIFRRVDGKSISAMLQGNKNIVCLEYKDPAELPGLLSQYFVGI